MAANEQNGRIHITGSGTHAGGVYSEVHVSGSGRIGGDVTVTGHVHVSGSARFDGSVKTNEIHTSGSLKIAGPIECYGETKVSGSLQADNDFTGKNLSVSGSGQFGGGITVQSLNSSGSIKSARRIHAQEIRVSGKIESGDVEAESFKCSGKANINGLLNAQHIDIKSAGDSRVREIGCEDIIVTREPSSAILGGLISLINKDYAGGGTLATDLIEGVTIRLEYTAAADVRGTNVYIGTGCKIGRVEYSKILEIAEDAVVAEKIKI